MCDYTVEVPQDVINQDPRMDYNFQLMGSFRDPCPGSWIRVSGLPWFTTMVRLWRIASQAGQ